MSRTAAVVHRVIKAYDVRGLVGDEIDEPLVTDVGAAFARLMREEGRDDDDATGKVALGYDMRESSPTLADAFAAGVRSQGLDVVRIGLASTDQLYFASGFFDCPGAMFTASHNPAAYNGIKLCRAGAKPVGSDTGLAAISDDVIAGVPAYDGKPGEIMDRDVLEDYGEFLRSLVAVSDLRPMRVAVDADRCFVVDERGEPVSPSAVTALVAARELHREIGATVIHNLITSRAVPELVIERGGTPVRSCVGHSYIKGLMADTGAIFGGEHSAHYYFRDFWGADSGMLAALHVLAALGEQDRPLSELMAD